MYGKKLYLVLDLGGSRSSLVGKSRLHLQLQGMP